MSEAKISCVQPPPKAEAAGTLPSPQAEALVQHKEVQMATARVGHEAPDFETMGYYEGGFKKFKLSDYRGQWVILCFYPGDFTFV